MTESDILRLGAHGAAVSNLQRALNAHGATITVDGWFGPATDSAIMAFQKAKGLVIDGVAGPKTWYALKTGGRDRTHLRASDLNAAAASLDVDPAIVRAVNEVESNGCGFLPDGRPVVLFERHIMYRELAAKGADVAQLSAQYPNLVSEQRGGYMGGAAENQRLKMACEIDLDCALMSASWGLFQIMGFHATRIGYESVEAFADRMRASEADQLDAFVRFVQADKVMLKALRGKKWDAFAELYNGPDYKADLYDVRLARDFEKYAALEVPA